MKKLLYILLFVPLALFGQDEYSLSFDGEDDYVEISNSLDFDLGDFTIIFKFKTPSITPNSLQGLVSKSCSGCEATLGDWFISYNHTDSGRVMLFTEKGGLDGFARTGILALDTWYNIGVRRIESTGELFITSNIIGAITDTTVNESGAPTGIINNTESFVFGNMMTTASPYEFEGFIDDVSLWNFNMSYQTMKDYMSCSPSGFEQGLVGYWNFNEGQGNKLNDISGNENHGVINGATYTEDVSETCSILDQLNQSFDAWNLSIDLSAGWNMFGYGCPAPIDLVQAMSEHTDNIIILKDNNGKAYMPEFGFNGIGDLTPGHGYQIKVTEAIEGFSLCDWYVNDIPEDN
ncbi:LamG domain-containing protein, partial [Flavobacteriales bacterium]|nr:LamG domain-containing protein [Flavobacteriales bacterium]